jgi:hypothetical protein
VAQEDADHDPEQYDCASCPVSAAYAALSADPGNVRAWHLYGQIANRFTSDTQSIGLAFDRLTRTCSDDEYADLLKRMGILVETFHPEKDSDGTGS